VYDVVFPVLKPINQDLYNTTGTLLIKITGVWLHLTFYLRFVQVESLIAISTQFSTLHDDSLYVWRETGSEAPFLSFYRIHVQ